MLSGSAREATTRQQKQLNKFSCFLNRELRYNCSIARSELFTSCGRFRGGFRPSRPHGTNVLGCDATLWIALSAAPHTSLVGGMTKITDHTGWAGRRCFNKLRNQEEEHAAPQEHSQTNNNNYINTNITIITINTTRTPEQHTCRQKQIQTQTTTKQPPS